MECNQAKKKYIHKYHKHSMQLMNAALKTWGGIQKIFSMHECIMKTYRKNRKK